ncbi:hypothetical protein EYF80_044085 [Liparis tanakae]|uniref:Uncharacterized protein n=1 Tax=Liparis tanakae TaxID=230148 RepID=A0A4Z2FYU8_9TELE|nr:hypothetical protein EYF80_044085 [Liparis tanakae]
MAHITIPYCSAPCKRQMINVVQILTKDVLTVRSQPSWLEAGGIRSSLSACSIRYECVERTLWGPLSSRHWGFRLTMGWKPCGL